MTTDTRAPDELELPHFKAHLWPELAELHDEQLRGQSLAPGHVVRLTRRRSRRSLVAVSAAAALVAGLVAGQLVGSPSETPLMGRIVAASDEASASSIVHVVNEQTLPGEAEPSSVTERWTDDTSDATRMRTHIPGVPDGQIDVGPLTGPTIDVPAHSGQRVVDYCTRQYVDHVDTDGASVDVKGDFGTLRDAVAAGRLSEDGTEVIDGRELIRLTRIEPVPGVADHVVLVDPDTYLPVRARGRLSSGETFSQTYDYLPRTAENLALLLPPLPEGFTQVDSLSRDALATCEAR